MRIIYVGGEKNGGKAGPLQKGIQEEDNFNRGLPISLDQLEKKKEEQNKTGNWGTFEWGGGRKSSIHIKQKTGGDMRKEGVSRVSPRTKNGGGFGRGGKKKRGKEKKEAGRNKVSKSNRSLAPVQLQGGRKNIMENSTPRYQSNRIEKKMSGKGGEKRTRKRPGFSL